MGALLYLLLGLTLCAQVLDDPARTAPSAIWPSLSPAFPLDPATAKALLGVGGGVPDADASEPLVSSLEAPGGFRISAPPSRGMDGRWRVTWDSQSGVTYKLQRQDTDALLPGLWMDVATVTADGTSTTLSDPTPAPGGLAFYRVVQVEGFRILAMEPVMTGWRITWSSQSNLTYRLQRATSLHPPDTVWADVATVTATGDVSVAEDLSVSQGGRRFYRVVQTEGVSTHYSTSDPFRFVPLSGGGEPAEGTTLQIQPDGTLPPFEFRPAGLSILGFGQGLILRFPGGAQLVESNGVDYLEFVDVTAEFGERTILQFAEPLTKTGGAVRRIALGPVSFEDLAGLFGMDPGEGISVTLFDRFTLSWRGGVVEEGGIRGGMFGLAATGLSLPDTSGAFPDFQIQFSQTDGISIPFEGSWALPDGSADPPTFTVGGGSPLWVTLSPDGRITVAGRVAVSFPNGIRFTADLRLDDPFYRIEIVPDGVQFDALSLLGGQLPGNPAACVPATAEVAALNTASICLSNTTASFTLFHQALAAAGTASGTGMEALPMSPPPPGQSPTQVLEAWAYAGLAMPGAGLGVDALQDLVERPGGSASSAPDLRVAFQYLRGFLLMKLALQRGGLAGSAGLSQALDDAVAQAEMAVSMRLADPALPANLDTALVLVEGLAALGPLNQELGRSAPAQWMSASVPAYLNRFAAALTSELGVVPGVYLPDPQGPIQGMSLYDAEALLDGLVTTVREALLTGVPITDGALPELMGQLGTRVFVLADGDLEGAQAQGDYHRYLSALGPLLKLVRYRQEGWLAAVPELSFLPDDTVLPMYGQGLDQLLAQSLSATGGMRSLEDRALELEVLLEVLRAMPPAVTFTADPFLEVYHDMEASLAARLGDLNVTTSAGELLAVLKAGVLHAELGRRFGATAVADWEGVRLPLVVARLRQVALSQAAWPELGSGVETLLLAGDRLRDEGESTRRRAALIEAAGLAETLRQSGVQVLSAEEGQRSLVTGPGNAELIFPGALEITGVRGAFQFNRLTGMFAGNLSGTVLLPQFNASLTLQEASLTSGGDFVMAAFGEFSVPPTDPVLTVNVPEARPLRIAYSEAEGLEISGAAGFRFDNGLYFQGGLELLDPIYSFSMQAGGLDVALLLPLLQQMPAFPAPATVSEDGLDIWVGLYTNLAASAEGIVPASASAAANLAPEQALVPLPSDEFISAEVYADLMEVQALLSGNPDPALTRGPLTEMVENLGKSLLLTAGIYPSEEEIDGGAGGGLPDPFLGWSMVGGEGHGQGGGGPTRRMQIDFGGPGVLYSVDGPAQDQGFIPAEDESWNAVTADIASGLVWSDGSSAPGITIDVGRRFPATGIFEWNAAPSPFLNDFNGALGLLDTDLLRDGILSSPFTGPSLSEVAVRIGGLSPGHFVIYGMAVNPPHSPESHILQLGKITEAGRPYGRSYRIRATTVPRENWVEGTNFVLGAANLTDAGDRLLVLSGPAEDSVANFGRLQALQIAEVAPSIRTFVAQPPVIDAGGSSKLIWETLAAASVTVEPGIGPVAERGEVKVRPSRTTTYTLTAANASGTRTATATVTVDGVARSRIKVAQGLRRLARIYRRMTTSINKVAENNVRGIDDYVDLEKMQAYLDQATTNVLRPLLSDPNARKDLKLVEDVASAALDLVGNYQVVGTMQTLDLQEVLGFVEDARFQYEAKVGVNTNTGMIDLNFVNAQSASQSLSIVSNVFRLTGSAALLDSTNDFNRALADAHFNNARAKILAAYDFDTNTTSIHLAGTSDTDLARLADQLQQLDASVAATGLESEVPTKVLSQIGTNLQDQALIRLGQNAGAGWRKRFEILQRVVYGNHLLAQDQQPARYENEIREEAARLIVEMAAGAQANSRFDAAEHSLLRFVTGYLPDAPFGAPYAQRLQGNLKAIQNLVSETWTQETLKQGVPLLESLVDAHVLIKSLELAGGQNTLPADLQPDTLIPTLKMRMDEGAGPNRRLKELAVFAYQLKIASKRLGVEVPALTGGGSGGAADPMAALLLDQARATAASAGMLAMGVASDLQANQGSILPFDLELPGNPKVTRVFGEVYYNRATGYLRGSFGGRLDFPEVNAFFEVEEATIASDGAFDLAVATGGPLPFGGVQVTASAAMSGQPDGTFSFAGDGMLILPTATSTQLYSVALSYDTVSDRFSFDSTAQNLDLRFTDDFVLFDAGFAFEVSTVAPEGMLSLSGSAGMFARAKPLPASVTRTNFHLFAQDLTPSFAFSAQGFSARLENGMLWLPEFFGESVCPSNGMQGASGPAILLDPLNPVQVTFVNGDPPSVFFSGAIDFRNLGFEVPGLPGLAVEVCSATLDFPTNSLPRLTNFFASIQIPIPNETARVDVVNGEWSIDGFPTGTIQLAQDLNLFEQEGFAFTLLGATNQTCPAGTGLTIGRNTENLPTFQLDGGIEMSFPTSWMSDTNGGRLFGRTCGFLYVEPGAPPYLGLTEVAFGGSFRLGGPDGLLVENALVELNGLTNIFAPTPQLPFVIELSGNMQIPNGPGFGLQNARFTFEGELLPGFTLGGLSLSSDPDFEIVPGLGVQVTSATLQFVDPMLPLPDLLNPANLRVSMSAAVGIPSGPEPIITGRFDDLSAAIVDGMLQVQLSGLGMGINNFEVPPLTLTGQVYIGGLDDPENLFFAGRVGGKLNGAGVVALVALDLHGPIGVCIDVSAGPAGIPLGPTGFLLTGVAGGVSFLNSNGDPCDFTSYYPVGDDGRPMEPGTGGLGGSGGAVRPGAVMIWEEFESWRRRQAMYEEAYVRSSGFSQSGEPPPDVGGYQDGVEGSLAVASAFVVPPSGGPELISGSGGGEFEIPCPTGDCPPPTINILCQPHPDAGLYPERVIIKFTSLQEGTLNDLGVTPAYIASLGLTTADEIALEIAQTLRDGIDAVFPRADPALVGEELALTINTEITNQLAQVQALFRDAFRESIQAVLGDSQGVYDAIVAAAYAGVPCPDATVKLTGTFSHATVSSFLSASVGTVLSSSGSAGLVGSVNLLGIPVGTLDGFVAVTDDQGNPNPSACGVIQVALGPMELGGLRTALECPGCLTGVLASFGQFAGCLTEDVIHSVILKVAPEKAGLSGQAALEALTDEEKVAFLAQLFTLPPVPNLPACFFNLVSNSWDSVQPSFTLCGDVAPKLFGLPLTDSLVGVQAAATKTSMAGAFNFSPSFLIQNAFLCLGTGGLFCQPVFPPSDQATFGFGLGFPDAGEAMLGGLSGQYNSPEAVAMFVEDGFDHMLANATYTIGYELSPFGFKTVDGEARVIMPNLTDHPAMFDPPIYVRPEDRGLGLPSRLDVLLAALRTNYLASPLWKGTEEDLYLIYAPGTPERDALAGLSFANDYFPYGGMAGAMRMQLPKAIVEAPPESLGVMLDPAQDLFARLGAASDFIGNHLLQNNEVGTLAFYIPAPNPPFLVNQQGQPLSPREMLEAIQTFDASVASFTSLYPVEQAFLDGYLDGQLLGVPIANARVTGVPVNPLDGSGGLFRVTAGVPAGSWLASFVDEANLVFEIKQPPPQPIEVRFTNLWAQVQVLTNSNDPAAVGQMVDAVTASLAGDLPKVSLEATIDNFRIPDPLTNLLTASSSMGMFAYSPAFEPEYAGSGPVAHARRKGGVAFQGQFQFANLVTVDNAELAVFPKVVGPPGMAGLFDVPLLTLPGVTFHDVLVAFNSEPDAGQPFLDAQGSIDPILLPPLLTVAPLDTNATRLTGSVRLIQADTNTPPQAELFIDPARVVTPLLGEGLEVWVHGASTNDPFTFSTETDWQASVSLHGNLRIRDVTGLVVLLEIGDLGPGFTASLSGTGLGTAALTMELPSGVEITAYPGAPFAQTLTLGNPGAEPITLTLASDGTFELNAAFQSGLNLAGLPISDLSAGATVRITDQFLQVTGSFQGGALAHAQFPSASGTFTITNGAVVFAAEATIPQMQFGRFLLTGLDTNVITAVLNNSGIQVPTGARLAITGVSDELLTLEPFSMQNNGDFALRVATGLVNVPGFFSLSGGTSDLVRTNGVVAFAMSAPLLTVFPGSGFSTSVPTPLDRLAIGSDGRFYYDSGTQSLNLPNVFSASGRLELGYEPDPRAPALQLSSTFVNLGSPAIGASSERTLTVENTGQSQLLFAVSNSLPDVVAVFPNFASVAPGQSQTVSIRFSPNTSATVLGTLRFDSTAPDSPHFVNVSGAGIAAPIWYQSVNTLNFGEQPVGQVAQLPLIIANVGQAQLTVSASSLPAGFSISPAGSVGIDPGEDRLFFVRFEPAGTQNYSGMIRFNSNDRVIHDLAVSGVGGQQRWYVQREGSGMIRRIRARSITNLWAVGDGGLVLQTDNGGHAWSPVTLGGTHDLNGVDFNGVRGIVVGRSGFAQTTTDSGATWTQVTDTDVLDPGVTWNDVSFNGTTTAVLAGEDGGAGVIVRQSTGTSFVVATAPAVGPLKGIQTRPGNTVGLAVGENGAILRSSNGGISWVLPATAPSLPGVTLNDVDFASSGLAIAVGTFGTVLHSIDSGNNWTQLNNLPSTAFLYDVRISDDGATIWIAGEGVLLRSDDQAASWSVESLPLASSLFAVEAFLGRVWTGGRYARIQHRPLDPVTQPILVHDTAIIDFGTVPVGASRQTPVRVANAGVGTLDITGISDPAGTTFEVSPGSILGLEPGEASYASVFFAPSSGGEHAGQVLLTSNDPDGGQPIQLQGRALTNVWSLLAGPTNENLLDVQFVSDTIGFAMSASDVFKTIDGGQNWARLGLNPPGPLRTMHWLNANVGVVAGGRGGGVTFQCDSNCQSTVMSTVNGGSNWILGESGVRNAFMDVQMITSSIGFAVTARYTSGQLNVSGDVLRTLDGGLTWLPRTRPDPSFDGRSIYVVSTALLYASWGGNLYRSPNGGGGWTSALSLGGSRVINDMYFHQGSHGWVVGNDANAGLLYHTVNGGATTGDWFPLTSLPTPITSVHFVTPNTGWFAANSAAIYRTDNGGTNTYDELGGLGGKLLTDVWGRSGTLAYAVGTDGAFRKYEPLNPQPRGIAFLPPVLDLGQVPVGSNVTVQVPLQNLGTAPLSIYLANVRNAGTNPVFSLGPLPAVTVAAGAAIDLPVGFLAGEAGVFSGELKVAGDGLIGATRTLLKAEAVESSALITLDSDPPGLVINVDDKDLLTPVIFKVVTPASAPDEWEPGSIHTIKAAGSESIGGVTYRFQTWDPPASDSVLQLEVPRQSQRWVARYVPSHYEAGGFGAGLFGGSGGGVPVPPADVPTGPYLRLSEAAVSVPNLGDLEVQGAAFLGAQRIQASLQSGALRVPVAPASFEVVEVTAGSWNLDYVAGAYFLLTANGPGLDLLRVPVSPPSTLSLLFEADGDYTAFFQTQGNTPVLPALFELGPATASLQRQSGTTELQLDATLLGLKHPDGQFIINQAVDFSVQTGPFTNTIAALPSTLLDLGFASLTAGSKSDFMLARNSSGVFRVRMGEVFLNLLGRNAGGVIVDSTSTGDFSFSLNGSSTPFLLGPFQWVANGSSTVTWNAVNGSVQANLSGGSLRSSSIPGWPLIGISVPGITMNSSGDFDRTMVLPSMTLNGLGLGGNADAEVNYLRLRRAAGVLSAEIHDEKPFFGSTMELDLGIASDGTVTGSFTGDFNADFTAIGLGMVPFADVALEYDPAQTNYQFQGDITSELFPNLSFRAYFGSAGQFVCLGDFCL